MKIIFLTVFYLVLINNSFAQVVISGKTANITGQPIASASITLSHKNSTIILAYSITDKSGNFHLSWKGQADSVKILASSLGFAKKEVIVPFQSAIINFVLEQAIIELKEVKAKAPPVWQRKDTINYNASEFKQQQDRVIGDIIARLPGVEVKPGGQILYNGKPINKYYIEGLDLLEDKYSIANNNIPADVVDKIQVLENHQPIRVLDSISFSDRAALNIKLKNTAKMRIIGRAKLGIGASPLLTEDELTAMLFKKKLQFINTYKYNNTGLDNTKELTSHNISEYINALQNGAVKSDLVSLAQPGNPPISPKRFLFNNAHVATINQLMPLNATHQLRINASYVNDFQQQQSSKTTKFYLPTDTIQIAEQNKFNSNLNLLQTDISFLANTPTHYLKNNIKFQGWWTAEWSQLHAAVEVQQQLNNPFFNFSNDFRLIKTKTRYIQEWGSYIGFVSLPHRLTVLPGIYNDIVNNNMPYDALVQEASLKTLYTDNYLSFRKNKSGIATHYKLGFNIQSQNMLTVLQLAEGGLKKPIADTFQNNLNWKRYRLYSENSWSYENNKWRLNFSLPISYNNIDYNDTLLKTNSTDNGFFVNPSVTAMLQVSPMWSVSATASYNQGFGDISNVSSGYILKTYRNLTNNNAPLAKNESGNASLSITYRNPLKIFFFYTAIMLSKSNSNLLYNQQFTGNLETLIAFRQDNYTNRATISGRISKYIINWKTSVGFNYSYGFGNQQQLQQNELVTFVNKNFSIGTTVSAKLSSKFTADYTGTYLTYQTKSLLQSKGNKIASANQTFSLNYYATAQLIFRAGAEHYYIINNFSPSANYYFADMSVRYKPKKSKIDYELGCQNILNTKEFTTVILLNNVETVSKYQIRPRQAIIKISFPF